jgi:hypothetical protein
MMMMMMHFVIVFCLFSLSGVSAFVITSPPPTTTTPSTTTDNNAATCTSTVIMRSSMDSGWDNDNFLESLSSGNEDGAIDRANEEYFRMSRYGRPEEVDWGDDDVMVVDTKNYDSQGMASSSRFGRRGGGVPSSPPDYNPNYNQYQQQQQQQQQHQPPPTHSFPPNNLYTANANDNPTTSYADSLQQSQQSPPQPTPSSSYSYNNHDDVSDDFVVGRETEDNTDGAAAAAPNNELPYPEDIEGAKLTDEMRTKAKLSHTDQEGASQGGSRFRELMTRAQTQQVARRSNPQPTQIITPTMVMTPEEIANLSIDQQARLYREFYHTQQEQQKQQDFSGQRRQQHQQNSKSIGSTSTNYLQNGIYGFDGKKIGHNKDIDAISNTSDEYFARLKRDSTTRNIARYSGDNTKANDIFHDPSIADINVVVNPYLKESRQRQLDVIETVPEEMLVFQEFDNDNYNIRRSEEDNKSFSGISYRNRIEQVQEAKRQQQQEQQQQQDDNNNNNNDATNDNTNNNNNNNSNNGW